MITVLGHFLNKTVIVSLPHLLPDEPPCVALLVGIEPAGLWLESEVLTRAIRPQREARPPPLRIFVPFSQIGYVTANAVEDAPQQNPQHHHGAEENATPPRAPRGGRGGKAAHKRR